MESVAFIAKPAGFTPALAAPAVMAVHEAMEQEMPVHDVTPIYLNDG
jgi:hypothetical protein